MGRGRSKAGGGNAKYNGFSITNADGKTENYIVVGGEVQFADGRPRTILGTDQLEVMQQAYDSAGSTDGIIKRVNEVGIGSAKTLSDKNVEKLSKDRDEEREQKRKQFETDVYKRKHGVNRHRRYWSAM